jgi:hypothetical protein
MTIFVHIGTEKTGTTYIQNFLSDNRAELLKQGYFFPKSPGKENHTKLAAYAQDDNTFDDLRGFMKTRQKREVAKFRKTFEKQLLTEIKECPTRNIIFSGEHCSSRLLTVREISKLKELFGQLNQNIKIVVYLRRQDQFLLSTYSTWIKSGATGKLKLPSQQRTRDRYDFAVLLSRWAGVFGVSNLIVRPYGKDSFFGGDLLHDFAHCLGFEINHHFAKPSKMNQSLDAEVLEFLRNLNFHLPGILDDGGPRMRSVLLKFLTRLSSKNGLTMDTNTLNSFLEQFEQSNKHVSETYLDNKNPNLFPSFEEDTTKVQQINLTQEAVLKMSAELWLMTYEEIKRLQNRVKRLNEQLE